MLKAGHTEPAGLAALLCDADGCLFPSEEPAFEASAVVTNRALGRLGAKRRYDARELRLSTTGKNFRTTIADLLRAEGIDAPPAALERWVAQERDEVTAHLGRVLGPDPEVIEPISALAGTLRVAVASSSASARLDACFAATGLDGLFSPDVRLSAEDSLPEPRSKPDPAIYQHALAVLAIAPEEALAVEDSVPGMAAAVTAGIPAVGNLQFVPQTERAARGKELRDAGAGRIVECWAELAALLGPRGGRDSPTPSLSLTP